MTTKLPRISIITAALNPGPEVSQTIESVLSQSYSDLQYIFVDGGSEPVALKYIEPYERKFSTFISERDEGISDAWNKAIALATGDIIGIINADDYLLPQTLNAVAVKFMELSIDPMIIHGDAIRTDGNQKAIRRPIQPFPVMIRLGTPVVHPATFVPKTVYERIGGFNRAYKIAMDYDFILRAYLGGVRFKYLPQPLVGFRGGGLSDRNPLEGFREVRDSQLSNGLNPSFSHAIYGAKFCVRKYLRPLFRRS